MDEGIRAGQGGQEGWSGVRLCNLAAQSALAAKGSVQAGGGEGTNRAGIGTMGDYLLQALQDPDSDHRAGDREGGFDAGYGQITWVLPGNDLCRLSGRSQSRR